MSNALFGCYHPRLCNQSSLITHSPWLFSQRLSVTHMSIICAQGLLLTDFSLQHVRWFTLPRLSSIIPMTSSKPRFLPLSLVFVPCVLSCSSLLAETQSLPMFCLLNIFFLPSLPPQAAHPQWFHSHIYVEDPNYLPISNYPLTFSCNYLVNESINWSCWHFLMLFFIRVYI